MSSDKKIVVEDKQTRTAISKAAHKCIESIQDYCNDAIYLIGIYSKSSDEVYERDNGKDISIAIVISAENGAWLPTIECFLNTKENLLWMSNSFSINKSKSVAFAGIRNAIYEFIEALSVCEYSLHSVIFDSGKLYNDIFYEQSNAEEGTYDLVVSSYESDYVGLKEQISKMKSIMKKKGL